MSPGVMKERQCIAKLALEGFMALGLLVKGAFCGRSERALGAIRRSHTLEQVYGKFSDFVVQ